MKSIFGPKFEEARGYDFTSSRFLFLIGWTSERLIGQGLGWCKDSDAFCCCWNRSRSKDGHFILVQGCWYWSDLQNKSQIRGYGSDKNLPTLKSEKKITKEQQRILWEGFDWIYLSPRGFDCLYRRVSDSWIVSCEIARSQNCRTVGYVKLDEIIQSLIAPVRLGDMVTPNSIYSG